MREALERLLAGESLYGICIVTDWTGRSGSRMATTRPPDDEASRWFSCTLKRVATSVASPDASCSVAGLVPTRVNIAAATVSELSGGRLRHPSGDGRCCQM
jgi:hypothetical protein